MMKMYYSVVCCDGSFPVNYFFNNYRKGMLLDNSVCKGFEVEKNYIVDNDSDYEKCVHLADICGECGITFFNNLVHVCETYVVDENGGILWNTSIENFVSVANNKRNNKKSTVLTLNNALYYIRARINAIGNNGKYPIVREKFFYVDQNLGIRNVSDDSKFHNIDLKRSINVKFNKYFVGEFCSFKYFLNNTDYGNEFDFDGFEDCNGVCVTEDGYEFSFVAFKKGDAVVW